MFHQVGIDPFTFIPGVSGAACHMDHWNGCDQPRSLNSSGGLHLAGGPSCGGRSCSAERHGGMAAWDWEDWISDLLRLLQLEIPKKVSGARQCKSAIVIIVQNLQGSASGGKLGHWGFFNFHVPFSGCNWGYLLFFSFRTFSTFSLFWRGTRLMDVFVNDWGQLDSGPVTQRQWWISLHDITKRHQEIQWPERS